MTSLPRFVAGFRPIAPLALCGATVLLNASPASAQGYGTIKGRLVFGGDSLPEAKILVKKGDANFKDADVCAKSDIFSKALQIDQKTKGIRFGAAYLVSPKGRNPEAEAKLLAKSEVQIEAKGCEIVPHVVAFHKNQTIRFKSSDPVPHSIRYSGFANLPDTISPPDPSNFRKKFASAERRPCKLVCDIHPWMDGYFLVFDHPFFAITGPDGSFEIKGVPAGTQNVVVWQESVGYVTPGLLKGTPVEVKADGTVDMGDVKLVPKK